MRLLALPDSRMGRLRAPFPSLLVVLAVGWCASLWLGQQRAPALAAERTDATALAQAIEQLPVVGSVLYTGAHPDDENSILLPYLAHGLHLRTAYLSATRGDGGQNLIGNEQYEALGILRTEELLGARRLDGAGQFFGQAYDFGFSKSAEETLQKWGREAVLGDFVRVIRTFRPDIVIARFSGTPADGHGHHQAAGLLTREAFRAAADPSRFPEQIREGLKPWQAARLFLNPGGRGASGPLSVNIDGFNPIYGRTYPDMGLEARSMHRSQGQGVGPGGGGRGGPVVAMFRLEDSKPGLAATAQSLSDGVDLTLNRFTALAVGSPAVARRVAAIQQGIDAARNALSPPQPAKVLPALGQGLAELRELRGQFEQSNAPQDSKDQALFLLRLKEDEFARAIALAGGGSVEALADNAEVIPDGKFTVTVTAVSRARELSPSGEISLQGPPGWRIERQAARGEQSESTSASAAQSPVRAEARFQVTVPADAPVSQPYWLLLPRTRDYFPPPPVSYLGEPQNPALLKATVEFSLTAGGRSLKLAQQAEVVNRYADRVYGERERPVTVVPPLAVWIEPPVAVFPIATPTLQQSVMVRVRNHHPSEQKGVIRLSLPSGWKAEPLAQDFLLAARGDEVAARFRVAPATAGGSPRAEKLFAQAVAEAGGQSFSTGYQIVDYPHIRMRYWFQPAVSKLLRFDVKVAPGLRVGYAMGSGDEVPEALRQMGVAVEQLSPHDIAFGDLRKYDVILTGVRAYEVRRDLVANHARLMDFVRNGGLMIVQYSRGGGYSEPLGPYPFKLGSGPRVTVEEAPVEMGEPSHPLFQSPNKITAADFDGWVQERGTYFMESWDPKYKPMLESHDPGEAPLRGGLLLASYGKGYYLYSGYTWFRQLPEGIPGAYRIFANMISLGKTLATVR